MSLAAFMDEYRASTDQNPFCNHERIWEFKVCFTIQIFDERMRFEIRSLDRGNGYASQALDWLCNLADKHGVMLAGHAAPFGKQKPMLRKADLKNWYSRHGFLVSRSGEINRLPEC